MTETAAARILIVDDNRSNVTLLERMLASDGFHGTTSVTDSAEAISCFLDTNPDLVFLDLHMPDPDGFAILAEIRRRDPDRQVPVMVLTADVTADIRRRALAAGAHDFLTKPFDRDELLLRTRNLLATREILRRNEITRLALQHRLESQRAADAEQQHLHAITRSQVEQLFEPGATDIVFQPIADLQTGTVRGVEALSRFRPAPHQGPNRWFAAARTVGLDLELELHTAGLALTAAEQLPHGTYVAINLSGRTLLDPRATTVLMPSAPRTVIEITEHEAIDDYAALEGALRGLRTAGAQVSVDDTGAGFASLQHILRLSPDIIKLDRALTTGVDIDPIKRALATSLTAFAHAIGASLIAEGVETSAELTALRDTGADCAQGYYLARPSAPPIADRVTV